MEWAPDESYETHTPLLGWIEKSSFGFCRIEGRRRNFELIGQDAVEQSSPTARVMWDEDRNTDRGSISEICFHSQCAQSIKTKNQMTRMDSALNLLHFQVTMLDDAAREV